MYIYTYIYICIYIYIAISVVKYLWNSVPIIIVIWLAFAKLFSVAAKWVCLFGSYGSKEMLENVLKILRRIVGGVSEREGTNWQHAVWLYVRQRNHRYHFHFKTVAGKVHSEDKRTLYGITWSEKTFEWVHRVVVWWALRSLFVDVSCSIIVWRRYYCGESE